MSARTYSLRYTLLAIAIMQLFPAPADAAKKDDEEGVCEDCPDHSGWSGWVEGGIGIQSDDSVHFGRYTGREDSGATLNAGAEVSYRAKDGTFLDGHARDVGLDARKLGVTGGKQGRYAVGIEYDQIPNSSARDARTPFIEQGGTLGLPAGWVPGANTSSMPTLTSNLHGTTLKTERDRLGVKFSLIPARAWELNGHYRHEEKDGIREVPATMGFSATSILPDAFNYKTDDFGVTLGYLGERLQARFSYAGSLFKSEQNAITWDNPFAHIFGQDQGRLAEAPDNQFHQLSAQLGYQLTDNTRLAAEFSRGRATQDEGFLPYTINPTIVTGALPANSLDGQVDSTLAKLEINSRPTPRLRLDASYAYSDRNNKTPVNTYEYVITDILLGPVTYQNQPYGFEQRLLRAKAGYRIGRNTDLSGGFDYDQMDRTYQQAQVTKDKTLWAKLSLQPMENTETRFKYSRSARDASAYTPAVGENVLMRVFNLADRTRDKVGLGVAYHGMEKLSLDCDLDWYRDDYDEMFLGLTKASGVTVTPTLTYVFNEKLSVSAYYSFDRLNSDQAGVQSIPLPPVSTPWALSDTNETQTLGLSAAWKAIPGKLDVGADVVFATFAGDIEYANQPNLPTLKSNLAALGVHGVYRVKDNTSLRAGIWFEHYKESDWAKNGAVNGLPTVLSLGVGPQDTNTVLLSLSLRYEFK